MKYGYDQINYTNFENDLYDARFELAASRIMDTDLETIEESVVAECDKVAANGKCHLSQLRRILTNHKSLCLTPFQLALLCGFADTDVATGMLDYQKFAAHLSGWITEIFSVDALRRKAQLVQLGHFNPKEINMPKYNENYLFAVFRECDRDANNFLEWKEYQQCLLKLEELNLTREECFTLNLLADVDGDGQIDY